MSRSVGSASGAPPSSASRRPSAASVACATSPSAPMAASSTSQAPSGRSPSSVRAVSVASLVLPEPPGPISVVSRWSAMSSRTAATSASRPTKLVSSARRLVCRRSSSRRPSSPRSSATCSCGQLRRGVDAQRVGQGFPRALVHEQRLGVATGAARARISAATSRSRSGCAATRSVSSVTSSAPWTRPDLRVEPVLHGRQAQPFEPGDRRVERFAVLQPDVLHGGAAPQRERPRAAAVPAVDPRHGGPGRRGVRTARRRRRRVPPSAGSRPAAPRPARPAAPCAAGKPGAARHSPRSAGGCSPQIQSTSVAFGTTWPGSSASATSSPRNRAPGTSARAPSSVRTSNGPSIPICTGRLSHAARTRTRHHVRPSRRPCQFRSASVRGRPNRANTFASKPVMEAMRSPSFVMTSSE